MHDAAEAHDNDQALKLKYQVLFLEYANSTGKRANWPYRFLEVTDMEDANFFKTYRNIKALEQDIWGRFFDETLSTLNAEPIYAEYTVREKLLAFSFTLIEVLKPYKGYVADCCSGYFIQLLNRSFLKQFKQAFDNYSHTLLEEGKVNDEVAKRMLVSKQYDKVLWGQVLFVVHYWSHDSSEDDEQTDAAIEKSVNLTFDLLGRNAVDTAVDLTKFLIQKATKNEPTTP